MEFIKPKGANVQEYILGNKETPWWTVGLSVMAHTSKAITFLSTPGQAYHDGMGFVQSIFWTTYCYGCYLYTFIPIYHRLKVYTA